MTYLSVQDLAVGYGKAHKAIQVVKGLNLTLEKGEIGCFLGYSGCGKTTALRAIAGLEEAQQGRIHLDETKLTDASNSRNSSHILPPAKRGMGMVFQDYALFGHLSIADNISFGLHKWAKSERNARVKEMLALVELADHANKKPSQLSGGQQQRVALARALAPEPKLLLLDEPFSNLDVILRESLATSVRDILKKTDTTAILVTHDQNEAFALADKVGVMDQGKLVQWATPSDLYHQPKTPFVASFIGEGAMISTSVVQGKIQTPLGEINKELTAEKLTTDHNQASLTMLIRPEAIMVDQDSLTSAKILNRVFRGSNYLYQLELADKQTIHALIPSQYNYEVGSQLNIKADLQRVVVF